MFIECHRYAHIVGKSGKLIILFRDGKKFAVSLSLARSGEWLGILSAKMIGNLIVAFAVFPAKSPTIYFFKEVDNIEFEFMRLLPINVFKN